MNKNKKKMSKKPRKKTKRPRYYKDKSVKQNVNVRNIINAGGGAGGGGSSSYPVPMPQYIQSPIPQAFQQTNTENMNNRSLSDDVKHAIKRPVYIPQQMPNNSDSVNAGFRDVSNQTDPIIKDIDPQQVLNYNIDDDISVLSEPQMKIPFGTNTKEASGNLSVFLQDMEQNPDHYLEEEPELELVQESALENNPILNPKSEDPNKSLLAQVHEQTGMIPEQEQEEVQEESVKPVKKSRAKKEYGEPYTSDNNHLLIRSNITGKVLDITDWTPWDRDSQIRINPNNPKEYINTESGILYKNGERKNISKSMKETKTSKAVAKSSTSESKPIKFVEPIDEEPEMVMVSSKRSSR